jgi:hypothetical protein
MGRPLSTGAYGWLAAATFVSLVGVPVAQAAYTITVTETGGDVVASGNGSFNLTALTAGTSGNATAFVQPNTSSLFVGPAVLTPVTPYGNVSGPANFGAGGFAQANSGSGSIAGIDNTAINVPTGYISGTAISGTATWTGQTFAGLGLTPGTYTWTWGTGQDADSLVLQVGPMAPAATQSIPTLSEWGMIILSSLLASGAILALRRQRL